MKYKLIACDFDGTLGQAPDYMHQGTVDAIKEYQQKGGKFVVCTGRTFCSIRRILVDYGVDCEVIASQGSIFANSMSGEIYQKAGIPVEIAVKIIESLRQDDGAIYVDYDNMHHTDTSNEITEIYQSLTRIKAHEVDDILQFVKDNNAPVQRVIFICHPSKVKEYESKYKNMFDGVSANSGAKIIVEFAYDEFSKGKGVATFADKYGIPYDQVMVMGDSTNDSSMFGVGFYGVAVGDAVDDLKKLAEEVAPDFNDNPVLAMLKKYCL